MTMEGMLKWEKDTKDFKENLEKFKKKIKKIDKEKRRDKETFILIENILTSLESRIPLKIEDVKFGKKIVLKGFTCKISSYIL